MTATASIHTDLITPLGPYLRPGRRGPAFLLESVDRGRPGRHSLSGMQFHPEAVLTPLGPSLIDNFLRR
ncbi:MAG TPA: hypothetical protein VHL78_14060 [Actinomycetota bacterium]|nr:hypothetical protein [Actinomycetota bacterium]